MKNDEQFLDELFERYYDGLFRYCLARLRSDRQAAADCAGDVFIAAKNHVRELKTHPDVKGWLFKAANNYIHKSYSRARKHASKTVSLERIIETHMETAFLDEDGHAIFAELEMPDSDIEKIKKAIKATLSEKELKLYIALFEEKKTLDEAARLLNISKDAARMRGKRLEIKIREMVLKYI